MWDVFSTRDYNMAHKLISHSLKEWNRRVNQGERIVKVPEEVLNRLYSAHYLSKKKGNSFIYALSDKRAWHDQEEEKETNIWIWIHWE